MMTADQLKNSILQLAMQGKLVEQRPEEGSGEELYEEIQAEKKRLIKEGKIKKQKPVSPIKDETPFDIPNGWKWVKLGDVALISTGDKDANHGCENGKYDFYTCSKEPIKSDTYSFDGECLLLPGNGANVGMTIYHSGKVEVYQRTYVIQKLGEFIDFHYLNNALDWNWKQYNSDKLFGSAIPYIKLGNLQNYVFPLPPLEEQKRIVSKIDELMPFVEQYADASTKLNNLNNSFPDLMKKSILQEAVKGKLVPQDPNDEPASELLKRIVEEKKRLVKEGKIKKQKALPEIPKEEIPFDIPESWKWVRLGEVIKEIIVPQRDKPPFSPDGTVPWCRIEDREGNLLHGTKSNQYVTEEIIQKMNLRVLPIGTVLSACTGGSIGTIVINTVECCTNQTFNGVVCGENLYNWYVYWFLTSQFSYLKSIGTGTTIAYISQDKTRELLFPLPPLAEQKRIVAKIEELIDHVEDLQSRI